MSATKFAARTAVITGASGGIGAETARGLLDNLSTLDRLFLCCRDTAKGERVAAPLRESASHPLDVIVVPVELTSASSVAACAEKLKQQLGDTPLDLLICNAGIMAPPLGFADDFGGLEQQFAVNHLSHALLSQRLLPPLRAGEGGRIVFVSSLAASLSRGRKTPPMSSERSKESLNTSNYQKWKMYAESKLAMSMYARALARREEKVECVSLHPGVVQTELARYILPGPLAQRASAAAGKEPTFFQKGLALFGFKTPKQGAELSLELACSDREQIIDGEFYVSKGGKLATDGMTPLLRKNEECEKVFEDAQAVLERICPEEVATSR